LLLHGLGDDETMWTRAPSRERHAIALGFAVLMPALRLPDAFAAAASLSAVTDLRRSEAAALPVLRH
jgi:hypothetical protein